MISEQKVRELIQMGNENLNLDYKCALSWAEASNDEKCEITKDVLAFANTRDGGVILIGVNDKTCTVEGLTEEQFSSFDQTKFNDFVQKFTDPRHASSVHRFTIDGKRVIAIDIPEFSDVPVLCGRDANSSENPSKHILRKSALYRRTERATSQQLEDSVAMRELLNRWLLRRQDEMLRAFKQIIQSGNVHGVKEPTTQFAAEVSDGEAYLHALGGGLFTHLPHWDLQIRPESYLGNRIQTAVELQSLVKSAAVSLRGWTFPIAGRVANSQWTNFEFGSQSFHQGGGTISPEALRVYKSGLVMWNAGFWEDCRDVGAKQDTLSFISLIYSVTEWSLFARRFFETILSTEDAVHFTIQASGVGGRRLVSNDPRVHIPWEYRTELQSFTVQESVSVSDLRADPEAIARTIIRKMFELFNWNDPTESTINNWQETLIQRRF